MSVATNADGRSLRASRTRSAIVNAHCALLSSGELTPSTRQIAVRAGVSPRTLFLHFPNLQALFAATADTVLENVLAAAEPVDITQPLPARAAAFLRGRFDLYGYITPFALASRVRERSAPPLRERIAQMSRVSIDNVAESFAPELAGLSPADYEDTLVALETSVTWAAWYHLREELGLDADVVHRILQRTVLALLEPR